MYTDDLLWRNFLSPQCRNCSRDPGHAHLGNTHSSQFTRRLRLHMAEPCTKFEVSSVSRCGDITWGVKFYKGSPDHNHPLSGKIFHQQGRTCYGKSMYQAMNGGAKCRKWGGLGQLGVTQGQPQCHHSIERIRLPIRL